MQTLPSFSTYKSDEEYTPLASECERTGVVFQPSHRVIFDGVLVEGKRLMK